MRATNEIIIQATIQLMPGNRAAIYAAIDEKKLYRKERQPLEYPNVGSIFKNVPVQKLPANIHLEFEHKIKTDPFPVLPSAVLIGAAGLKEFRVGDAIVSPKHPNFIVNIGRATASDVRGVMAQVQKVVKEKFGVELEPEVIVVG
jgi:UDP-N-acetylmuramate dehydrogenase